MNIAKPFRMAACSASLVFCGLAGAQTADTYITQVKKPGTGDDSKARLEIRRLTNFSFRPTAETERSAHEASLLNGLKNATDWEIKAFLIEELRFDGKTAAISPLAAYLGDANLCEPAMQSLMGIATTEGADKVSPAVRTALPGSSGKCRTTLMRAAGSLRDGDAAVVDLLVKEAAGSDKAAVYIALRGLANIGDLKGRAALTAALKATDPYDAHVAASLNLLFAQRLAERGLKTEGNDVANAVKTFGTTGNFPNVVLHADSTLAAIKAIPTAVALPGAFAGRLSARAVGGKIRIDVPAGAFTLKVADARGRVVASLRRGAAAERTVMVDPPVMGVYQVTWEGAAGRLSRSVVLY
jgi:hypothetical protein